MATFQAALQNHLKLAPKANNLISNILVSIKAKRKILSNEISLEDGFNNPRLPPHQVNNCRQAYEKAV